MIDVSTIRDTGRPQPCALPCFDATYLSVLFDKKRYKVYTYADVINGEAPLTEQEAIEQIADLLFFEASPIPIIVETTLDATELRAVLQPLFVEPFDQDFLDWQNQFIVSQVHEPPIPQVFNPVSLKKNLMTDIKVNNVVQYAEGVLN